MGKKAWIILILCLSISSVGALFHTGLPPTHDGEYHVVRFFEFNKALMGGGLYPRWAKDLNFAYGLPLFNFVYPLPNFLAAFLHVFHFSFIDSFKIEMIISTVIGGVFFYLWSKEYWGESGGFISSVLYLYSPYRFLDIFIRGSVGEVWAISLFPAFLWSIKKLSVTKKIKYFYFSSFSLALIILSHNILGLLYFGFAILYIFLLLYIEKKKIFPYAILICIYALGISSIFWMPALLEKKYTVGLEVFDYREHFPQIWQLLLPSWGSGFSGVSANNQMSFQIGVVNIIAFIVAAIGLKVLWRNHKKKEVLLISSAIVIAFITFFMMLKISQPLWYIIPLMNYFQFPWRLLSIEIIVLPFIAGSILSLFSSKWVRFVVLSICLLCIFATRHYNKVPYFLERSDNYYITHSNFIDGTNSPGNAFNTKWVHNLNKRVRQRIEDNKDISGSQLLQEKNSSYLFSVTAIMPTYAVINSTYFPGWNVYIDGIKKPITITENGLISFLLPKGHHIILIKLENTIIQSVSLGISLLSIIFLSFHGTIKKHLLRYANRN